MYIFVEGYFRGYIALLSYKIRLNPFHRVPSRLTPYNSLFVNIEFQEDSYRLRNK